MAVDPTRSQEAPKCDEEDPRASEERLRQALDAARLGTFEYDPQTGRLSWDAALKRMWGLGQDEELDLDGALRRIHPDDQRLVTRGIASAFAPEGNGDYEVEFRVVLPDGTVRWHASKGRVYFPENSANQAIPIRLAGVESDITEQKRSAAARREDEARLAGDLAGMRRLYELRAKISNQKDLNCALDDVVSTALEFAGTDRGILRLATDRGERLEIVAARGYRPGNLLIEYFRHADTKGMCDAARRERRTIVIEDIATLPPFGDTERDIALAEDVRATMHAPMFTRSGDLVGILSVQFRKPHRPTQQELRLFDLLAWTAGEFIEHYRAEQARHEIQERYRLIVEAARDHAILTTDIHGTITTWSPGAAAVFGYAADEVIGKPFDNLYLASERKAGQPLRELTIAEQSGVAHDIGWHLHKSGEQVFIEGFTRALRTPGGELTGFLKIGQDVTERRRIEQRLRESEERTRLFVENVREYALIQLDRTGRITSWNPGAERLFGYETHEIIGKYMSQFLTLEDRGACVFDDELARVITGERTEDARWLVRKDGSRFWAHWVTEPIRRESGELRSIAKLMRDETERMQVEEALRASERRFHAVANFIPDLLWQSEPDGSTLWYNDRWYQYTGQTPAEAAGFGWTAAIHPDDREESRGYWVNALQTQTPNFRREYRIRRADGEYRWFLVQTEPLRDENGQILRWFGTATDVHEQRVASDALARSEASLRTTLASLSDAVIATDAEGFVHFMNSVAEELTGWTQAEAFGKSIEDVYRLATLQGTRVFECQVRRALSRGEHIPRQRFILCARGGRDTPIQDAASPIFEGDRIIGAVSIFSDISEQVRFEEQQTEQRDQLEKDIQTTSEALGATRRELQILSGHLMMAQEDERRRVASELHDDIGQRTALLEFEVERLRESSLASKGVPTTLIDALQSHVRDLASGLREVSHRLHPSFLENLGVAVALRALVEEHCRMGQEVSFAEHGTPILLTNEVKTALYRIAQEALRNALKHAPGAPVHVILRHDATYVLLTIEDAGPGFDVKEIRARVGLGLLSIQERTRAVGGEMILETTKGEGTHVSVRVPVTSPSV